MRRALRGHHGGYPVPFLPISYEPLGLVLAAAIARCAYRNRSAFGPFAITGAAFVAAAYWHVHHPGWSILIAMMTGLTVFVLGIPHRYLWSKPAGKITTSLLARAWEKCGIDRPAERGYATTVIAVAGGWLAAATAIGPTVESLPAIAGIATVILGIPWWAHRRRRARVRAYRTIQTWPTIAENMGLPGSRIASIVVDV
jgi:S-DNA-T family DNA segregation ATPase FtsK/SpoIIIE